MKVRVPQEIVPGLLAFGATAVVVCALPGELGILPRIGMLSFIGLVWLERIWPWD